MKRCVQTLISRCRSRTASVFQDVHTGDFTVDLCEGLECATVGADDKAEAVDMAEDFVFFVVDCNAGSRCGACIFCMNGQKGITK